MWLESDLGAAAEWKGVHILESKETTLRYCVCVYVCVLVRMSNRDTHSEAFNTFVYVAGTY